MLIKKGQVFIISSPSGGGKTSLIKALINEMDDVVVCISHTTRKPRRQDIDGQDYFFVDKNQFKLQIHQKDFIEYAKVFDSYYGTSREQLCTLLRQNKSAILEIDWQGARQVRQNLGIGILCCASIFILPPSIDVLKQRLTSRGQDSEAVIRSRMEKASEEISHANEYDHIITNESFDKTLLNLKMIIHTYQKRYT
jgi:guanylate kinase